MQIKISERLFRLLLAYHIEHMHDDEIEFQIIAELNDKLERMTRRIDYMDKPPGRQDTRA